MHTKLIYSSDRISGIYIQCTPQTVVYYKITKAIIIAIHKTSCSIWINRENSPRTTANQNWPLFSSDRRLNFERRYMEAQFEMQLKRPYNWVVMIDGIRFSSGTFSLIYMKILVEYMLKILKPDCYTSVVIIIPTHVDFQYFGPNNELYSEIFVFGLN